MKKLLSMILAIVLALAAAGAGTAENAAGGTCTLQLNIGYEENLFMAKYAVDLLIDNEKITTMQHGQGYSGAVSVTPGSHTVSFVKSDDASVSGSCMINPDGDASFSCTIHSKTLSIAVDGVQLSRTGTAASTDNSEAAGESGDDQMMAPEPAPDEAFSGPNRLDLVIEFKENMMLSRYDVDLYLDDVYVTTLPHGTGYQGTFGVQEGVHVLTFVKNGDRTVRGVSQFSVEGDTSFSCAIECKNNKVKVSEETIGGRAGSSPMNREEYISACRELVYRDVERNPGNFAGMKTKVTGTVVQVSEGWFDSVVLRVRDTGSHLWYVTYTREKGESRILENDKIEIYGECRGVKTYLTVIGGSVTIPAVDAKYIEMK